MKKLCPNLSCQSKSIVKDGYYFRKNDSRKIARFQCKHCLKKFSSSTYTLEYQQKKRRINSDLAKLLSSGISQRRAAEFFKVNRKTVARKHIFLALKARIENKKMLQEYFSKSHIKEVQFDDLITSEHTKCKPLTVTSAVEKKSRIILGTEVAQIPAFGKLAKISQAKYGKRKSYHKVALNNLFSNIKVYIHTKIIFESDQHKLYPEFVKRYFSDSIHLTYKGGRGAISGQGELKRKKFDPLFSINHTYASYRANINRLFRRTWCTTKEPARLKDHLDIYIYYHNKKIINKLKLKSPP